MASTSSSTQGRSVASSKQYDAFISHRGPDVKDTLAKQLYDLLKARGCRAFLDREEIEGGESITSAISNAICSSRVQIAIFSKRYAESKWCLDELLLMLQQTDALFIPVFYGVEPKELRSIDRGSYAEAFSSYQSNDKYREKAEVWKEALSSTAAISGYEDSVHKEKLCEKIVSRVLKEIEKRRPLYVAKYPVALSEQVQNFENSCPNTAGTIGIYGPGGFGKTTLSRELFNRKRLSYDASCFLSDVRESHARRDLHSLQSKLLKDLFGEKRRFRDTAEGVGAVKDRLEIAKKTHFLIIVDDIDHQDQLDALIPEDTLGSGSLVIITTRDQILLRDADVRYKMREMEKDHAKELFCSHAFHKRDPPSTYEELVESFVEYCGGLPLSLMVLGAHVYLRDQYYWKLELEKARKFQPKDITKSLKISFDCLDREEKQIFIDIACLFNKKEICNLINKAITIWKASGWSAEHALQTLKDKCLLEVVCDGRYGTFAMHDHLRDLGMQMADELSSPRFWRSDILKSMGAKGFRKILAETKGRSFHSIVDSSLGKEITYFIADGDLLWLEIHGSVNYAKLSPCIPRLKLHNRGSSNLVRLLPRIPQLKLHILDVSQVKEFWRSFQQQLQANTQATSELRKLKIWKCSLKPPYRSMEMLKHLEELEITHSLENTTSLVQSLQHLSNLRSLNLSKHFHCGGCRYKIKGRDSINLDSSTSSRLKRLETVRLNRLQTISNLVISGEMCPELRSLVVSRLDYLNEMELKQIQSLNALTLNDCQRLNALTLNDCPKLETVSGLSSLTGLRQLKVICGAGLRSLPGLAHFRRLGQISIVGCPRLQSVEGIEELPELNRVLIQMPDDGYDPGLRMPLVKRTILTQMAMPGASAKLTANLLSEVIGDAAVSEIETGEYEPTIESSPSAITIYTLLVEPDDFILRFEHEEFWYDGRGRGNLLITFLLEQCDSKDRLSHVTVRKGFKAIVKVEEESKALNVLQRIVDRLYKHTRKAPDSGGSEGKEGV